MNHVRIIQTEDGSSTLIHAGLNETYHSIHGAIQESQHVFIQAGLHFRLRNSIGNSISILEVGFGTGLNALLTALVAKKLTINIEYTAIEAYPLPTETVDLLNYTTLLVEDGTEALFKSLHQLEWNLSERILENFRLLKSDSKLQEVDFAKAKFDLVYFDAFAPDKQPEMWERSILRKVTESMNPQAIFVTYSAKGQLKRDLVSLGLSVEKIPGPPGKREMIRATRQ